MALNSNSNSKIHICVVGGGIIGLSSALEIQKSNPQVQVTLISEKFSPDTTGDGAAGIWGPFLLKGTDPNLIIRWSKLTHDFLLEKWRSEDCPALGIAMIPCFRVSDEENYPEPFWSKIVYGFETLTQDQLTMLGNPQLKNGHLFTTFTCEPAKLLPIFLSQFILAGGTVLQRKVEDFRDLKNEYQIIVNCTGVQAHHMVNDSSVQPIRGQVMRVEAPWITHAILDDSETGRYIIPNQRNVVLGGTHQEGDWNLMPDSKDREFIKKGCLEMIPSLKDAKFLRDWVGLRPGRNGIRLELETIYLPGKTEPFQIIHNYGHGGSGITLFYGCAQDANKLTQKAISRLQVKSKL